MESAVLQWVATYGYFAIFGLLVFGIVGIPVPDEFLLTGCGFLIYRGQLHLIPALASALGGSMCGITCSYIIGRTLGWQFLHSRAGRLLHIRDQQIRINQLELSRNQLAISRQNTQRWMYIGGILLLGTIGGLLFRQSRHRKKANAELRRLNTDLEQANQVKARLFGVLSHDLRSPISNLISFLNLQKENPGMLEPAQAEIHQGEITRSAGNLLDTMEDLLLWSKEQMRHFSPQSRHLLVTNLFEEMRRLYPDTGRCRLNFECPPELTLYTDENFLKTILRNLTTNSMKAVSASPGGHITWKAWETTRIKYLSISDNGPGISPQALSTLLTPNNAQPGPADLPSSQNRLGLHLIRDFATAIGCNITVDTSPGTGSRFTLAFA